MINNQKYKKLPTAIVLRQAVFIMQINFRDSIEAADECKK